MIRTIAISSLVLAACSIHASAVTFDWVTVGNPGNADDTHLDGYGGVDYTYRISKYEVTAGQYTEFLNAVAASDPYGLYNASMWSNSYGCKIEQLGSDGSYTYQVAADRENRPVNFVSFLDALRFTNWLHNGQGGGDTETGAYTIRGGRHTVRSANAKYYIPSEDEWYKAAYYDPNTAAYYDYPTGTDSTPSNDLINPDPGNNANFHKNGFTIGSPYYTTEVGEFENSVSPYGTFDQGGNVWEWNEAVIGSSSRGLRGGSFDYAAYMHADIRFFLNPSYENDNAGFRVAHVPEPDTVLLAALASAAFLVPRRCRGRWAVMRGGRAVMIAKFLVARP